MRIAIYGAGSLGTILGAYISKAGVAIELINRNNGNRYIRFILELRLWTIDQRTTRRILWI